MVSENRRENNEFKLQGSKFCLDIQKKNPNGKQAWAIEKNTAGVSELSFTEGV